MSAMYPLQNLYLNIHDCVLLMILWHSDQQCTVFDTVKSTYQGLPMGEVDLPLINWENYYTM